MSGATFIITNIPSNVKKIYIYMQNNHINNLIIQYSNNSKKYIYLYIYIYIYYLFIYIYIYIIYQIIKIYQ